MKKNSQILIILIAIFSFWLTGCKNKQMLSVTGGKPISYQCETGEKIIAKYYSLSDHSLDFVKITMPDRKEYTLPRVLSASGVRYTDDAIIIWWTKGDTAFAEKRGENGNWQILFSKCMAASKK